MDELLSFRVVSETDLPLLHLWLNRPHLRRFYQKQPISLDEVRDYYLDSILGREPTWVHLALLDGRPFGYIQCYRCLDYPEWAHEIGLTQGISIDLYIGEPDLLGRGLGKRMERDYVLTVAFPLYPEESECFICHEPDNAAALACSRAVGFMDLHEVTEAGIRQRLLVLRRPGI